MNKYHIRYNKSKGMEGRGTVDHVWRVFENGKEYLFKHLYINVPVFDEKTIVDGHEDWNITCYGYLYIDKNTSTAIIGESK